MRHEDRWQGEKYKSSPMKMAAAVCRIERCTASEGARKREGGATDAVTVPCVCFSLLLDNSRVAWSVHLSCHVAAMSPKGSKNRSGSTNPDEYTRSKEAWLENVTFRIISLAIWKDPTMDGTRRCHSFPLSSDRTSLCTPLSTSFSTWSHWFVISVAVVAISLSSGPLPSFIHFPIARLALLS